MSEERHTQDEKDELPHVDTKGTEGGQCLNSHAPRQANNSCSHIWQALKKAESDRTLYDWPRYKDMPSTRQVFRGRIVRKASAPKEGDWDIKPGNFDTHCDVPYFHEAHHIIPNSTLSTTIASYFGNTAEGGSPELVRTVRGGLLSAGYNLNHLDNMIMLPLDAVVARVLRLPRHRTLPNWHHSVYSKNVKEQLEKILGDHAEDLVDHKSPKYKDFKAKLIALSKRLYETIKTAGEDRVNALDDIDRAFFL